MNEKTGALEGTPEVIARGLVGVNGGGENGLIRGMQRVITKTFESAPAAERRDMTLLKERVRVELKRFIQKQTGGRPVIVPVVVQI